MGRSFLFGRVARLSGCLDPLVNGLDEAGAPQLCSFCRPFAASDSCAEAKDSLVAVWGCLRS